MARLSILFGSLLVILALVGYFIQNTATKSPTALIPAIFGVLLILPGIVSVLKPKVNMHAMHVSALVGLLGAFGGLFMSVPKLIGSAPLARPLATGSQLITGILCLIFVILCVRSFINARRNRAA
ncbi:hypothetical protein JIN85_08100 [Luteolibacter pohnpeiensis]|uniref:Uncharacterized protein n=1 Tax=Luteolibacter pohnpeiensis TaxID=454153 RepID=A0A934S9Z5_9BACT|nr:hypothetical protein [Luteolibacter pohnpeiensis]MBK1882372.1 hypothetical protein [Luteolibacter pohnpeiensis]